MGLAMGGIEKPERSTPLPPLLLLILCCRAARLALSGLPPTATSRPSACSWRQAPTRTQPARW